MFVTVLKLLLGCVLLLEGGDWLVNGSVAIAKRFNISALVIGMTIVALGTSAPELLVSLIASVKGSSGIALGNVIGSNFANIALILGLTAMICPIAAGKKSVYINGAVMILVSVLLVILMQDGLISRVDGLFMTAGIVLFVVLSIVFGRTDADDSEETDAKEEKPMKPLVAVIVIIVSCAALAWGADLLVDSASEIARAAGVSEKVIGLTVVALGTSLPELAASLIAAIKKQMDISIGNIIGSNIFNILAVLGISSAITPISLDFQFYWHDLIIMHGVALMLMIFLLPWGRWFGRTKEGGRLGRIPGFILFATYIAYMFLLF